ncbi:hypothetical protein BV898_10866 [Hypsibius exemplaris]|uniref:Uncharacterized protein n=1 Tax=Hypsibius exemplaris TaxID=2072580 RepID=A0A1W0WIF9_HYPEX|nr:hypothetical protein BV898_10866 [Hypsibius exemplaris]
MVVPSDGDKFYNGRASSSAGSVFRAAAASPRQTADRKALALNRDILSGVALVAALPARASSGNPCSSLSSLSSSGWG